MGQIFSTGERKRIVQGEILQLLETMWNEKRKSLLYRVHYIEEKDLIEYDRECIQMLIDNRLNDLQLSYHDNIIEVATLLHQWWVERSEITFDKQIYFQMQMVINTHHEHK
jgi:hypothetical protein